MKHTLSLLISWGCTLVLYVTPLVALYFLLNIDLFYNLAKNNLHLAIQWSTVSQIQLYSLWFFTVLSLAVSLMGIYFLRRAFTHFSKGEFFTISNSRDLRKFSIFLLIQAVISPLHFTISSLLLSINHPAGEKILAISFGSNEIKIIILAIIFWVISDLLVKANILENENKQFI